MSGQSKLSPPALLTFQRYAVSATTIRIVFAWVPGAALDGTP